MLKRNAVKLAMCAIAAMAAIALAGCGGSGAGDSASQQQQQQPQGQEQQREQGGTSAAPAAQKIDAGAGVTFRDMCSMSDQELTDALNASGYQQKSADGDSVTYAKDGIEVIVNNADGYRVFAPMGDEYKDLFAYVAANAPDASGLSEYTKGELSYFVGVATVAHDDGVVAGNANTVFIVQNGHFSKLLDFIAGIDVDDKMDAQTTAAHVAQGLIDAGFES